VRASPRRSAPSFRVPNAVFRVPLLSSGFTIPEMPFHGSEAGKRRSEAWSRASEPCGRGSEGRFHGLEGGVNSPVGGVNGPVAGIRASEARVSHRVGGKRTPLDGATGSENPRDARRSRWIAVPGARLPFPVRRADETGVTAQSVQCRNGKGVKENVLF
jgi:hypothetical protein